MESLFDRGGAWAIVLTTSLLAFAGPMLPGARVRRTHRVTRAPQRVDRAPVIANFAAFILFLPSLPAFAVDAEGIVALLLAASGLLLAVAGTALVVRSRAELGAAWSLVPMADRGTGLVTTGPYRRVRHPIYLGFIQLAVGQALAFGSWPAFLIVVCGIIPTFVWRARAEEVLLSRAFGESYTVYQRQTGLIIPLRQRGKRWS